MDHKYNGTQISRFALSAYYLRIPCPSSSSFYLSCYEPPKSKRQAIYDDIARLVAALPCDGYKFCIPIIAMYSGMRRR